MPDVGEVTAALDDLAPFADACDWDNVGLLLGRRSQRARDWLVALDLTDAVAGEALAGKVDGLILYHPPIFQGIRGLTADSPGPTGLLPDLAAAGIALLATHTAMDCAVDGTNDALLDCFDCGGREPLRPIVATEGRYKLVVFVPAAEVAGLRAALSAAGAGVIGHYDECSFALSGRGSFRGDASTNPTRGRRQELEQVDEIRLEMVLPAGSIGPVVRTLYRCHSYEEPAFDLYPLHAVAGRAAVGLGRRATLTRPARGTDLLRQLAMRVDCSVATVVGTLRRRFRRVVAAAGSFGVDDFRDAETLYLTGEFKHHDALQLLRRDVTAVHLGHYQSERLVLDRLCRGVRKRVKGVRIRVARRCRGPFQAAAGFLGDS